MDEKYKFGFVYVISAIPYAFNTRALDLEKVSSYLTLLYLNLPYFNLTYLTLPYN
jgi:hypothetical protein